MNERFSKLFALTENLYANESPVIIVAGSLLKDNQTGKILAQIKFRNISEKSIKALKVKIISLDTVGKILGEEIEHQYLDLSVNRDNEFGQKEPITLPDISTRAFSVEVTEISFTDNTQWISKGNKWEQLEKPVLLENHLHNIELAKQYKIKFNLQCKYFPKEDKDLWHCSCGAINHKDEAVCHSCKCKLSELLSIDISKLKSEMNDRLKKEIEEREKLEAQRAEKIKKNIKIAKIAIPISIVVITLLSICIAMIINHQEKTKEYNSAVEAMENENYEYAYDVLEKLGDFKNSKKLYNECKLGRKYIKAKSTINNYSWCDEKDCQEAYKLFKELGDFKDSKDYLEKFEYKLINKQMINNSFTYTVDYNYKEDGSLYEEEINFTNLNNSETKDSTKRYEYNYSGELETIEESEILSPHFYGIKSIVYSCSNNRIIEGEDDYYYYYNKDIEGIYYSYNKNGDVSKIKYDFDHWDDYDDLIEKYEYTYDKDNKIKSEILYENNKKAYVAEYNYDSNGLITSIKYVAVNGKKDISSIDSKKAFVDYCGEVVVNYNYGYVYVDE